MTVVAQIIGGLGNQMFQYALGRTLAIKCNVPLKLDTSLFERYPMRPYALGHFSIAGTELTASERRELGIDRIATTRIGRLAQWWLRPSLTVVREQSFEFDPLVLRTPDNCYLEGYWQSPKYFSAIETTIRSEFVCKEPPTAENVAAADRISESPAVSVHVRRGDYVSNDETHRYHGTCGPEYYAGAEARVIDEVGRVQLFVFSDDPDWAEENLPFRSPTTVLRHNGPKQDYEDLRLMTLCRHHIIANSTFSWWGAWLCRDPGKIVIAPKNWFNEANHDTSDLIPEGWIRL